MIRYKLFRVKEGKINVLKDWAEELRRRESEVVDTLVFENVQVELMHLFQVGSSWFVMGIQDIAGQHRKADLSVELNKRHFATLEECLEPYDGEVLYRFAQT